MILSKRKLIKPSNRFYGLGSSEIWKRVCRKAATLKELKESVCDTTAGKK